MNNTFLTDRQNPFILKDNKTSVLVESGSVDVYLCNFINNKPQRRLFLKQINKGQKVPGFNSSLENKQWHFLILASPSSANNTQDNSYMEKAKLRLVDFKQEDQDKFINGIDKYISTGNFEQDMVQHYLLSQITDARNIYVQEEVNKTTKDANMKKLPLLFTKNAEKSHISLSEENDDFYAIALICRRSRIKYYPYNTLTKQQKDNFNIEDYANYCGFNYRKISLADNWYKQNSGHLLCFDKETGKAVACFGTDRGSYYATSNKDYKIVKVNKRVADRLENYAYVLYRPLPSKKLNISDIFKYSLTCISKSGILKILLFCMVTMILSLFVPQLNQEIYNTFIPEGDYAAVYGCCSLMICILVGSLCFSLVKSFLTFSIFSKARYQLQEAVFERLFKLKQSFIDKYESADLALRASGVSTFSSLNSQILGSLLSLGFSIIFLIQMFMYDTILAVAALLLVLLQVVLYLILSIRQIKYVQEAAELSSKKSSILFQLIRGITKLRVSNAEQRGLKQYMEKHIKSSRLSYKIGMYSAFLTAIAGGFAILSSLVFYAIICFNGFYISVGTLMAFVAAFGMFSSAVLQVPNCLITINNLIPVIRRLMPILEEVPELHKGNSPQENITGAIEVSHLSFTYNASERQVINDISFRIKPGEYIGIVGSTGCGKSTLLNLLLGFASPTSGKIFYDNIDLDQLDKLALRKNFGVVLQDGSLVADSIINNIKIATPQSSLKEVQDVVKLVGLEKDINNMPMGLETVLSEGSGLISGGQKQRILIARALIGKPKILFFDEATSSLDNNTQKLISDNLESMGMTRVVIAHRLSTVINCDRIFVIDNGEICEQGNFKQLMENRGKFYDLAKKQIL